MNYGDWPTDEHGRWIRAGNLFGRQLMEASRDYALDELPDDLSDEVRQVAEKAALDAIYGMMMLLDGVVAQRVDEHHTLALRLLADVEDDNGTVQETFELAPDGDGLCMGFHGWVEGDFGPD